jgi:Holliday junction resolvase RusA-like endonuclease
MPALFFCHLLGEPVAQARPRIVRGHAFYPAKSQRYRKQSALHLQLSRKGAPPLSGPLKLVLCVYRQRPKSNKNDRPVTKPDLSNYIKMLEDALVDAGVVYDDAQICVIESRKEWATPKTPPSATIELEAL